MGTLLNRKKFTMFLLIALTLIHFIILGLPPHSRACWDSEGTCQKLTIGEYFLVSQKKISGTIYENSYQAKVTNPGPLVAKNVSANAKSLVRTVTIVEGHLNFGDVPAGGTVTSSDTFTIRVDTRVGFKDSNIYWNIGANYPPIAQAGPDKTYTLLAGKQSLKVQLDGSRSVDPCGFVTKYVWTGSPDPADVAKPIVTLYPGTYSFTLVVTDKDGQESPPDTVTITVLSSYNQAPVVNAGSNQTITLPASATLNGTATDDGLPAGSTLTVTWSKVSGPGTVTFANAKALSTTASFSVAGTYVLRLTASDSQLSSKSDVTITVNPANQANQPPVVNAGSNQTITLPASATLNGTATDDGLPAGSTLTVTWSKVSGPGTVTFGNTKALSTTASFSVAGTYVLRLTASDSQLSSKSDVTITVNPANQANQPPVVNAGSNQTITLPASATLNGTATDDGLPAGSTLTVTWSKVSGPGTVTFANAKALSTTASFSVAGTYVLRLTASDSQLSSKSDVTITVNPANQANQPPVVNAGSNQTITLPASATLNGTATDDGLPAGSTLTVTWNKVSGPGTVTFGNSNLAVTTATFSQAGTYVLRLTANDSQLSSSSDVTITVNQPPVANAGPNQTVTLPVGQTTIAVQLDGSASKDPDGTITAYSWTGAPTGTPTPAAVAKPSVILAGGTYTFTLTVTDNNGATSQPSSVTVLVNKPPVANAGPNQTLSVPPGQTTTTVQLDGSASKDPDGTITTYAWSGTQAPSPVNSANPKVTLSPGVYTFSLIVTDNLGATSAQSTVTVQVLQTSAPTVSVNPLAYNATQDQKLTVNVSASKADGSPVTLTAKPLITNASFSASAGATATGIFEFVPNSSQSGVYMVSFTAHDQSGLTDTKTVQITVGKVNHPPVISVPVTATVDVGKSLMIPVTASDPDGDTLTFSSASLPQNAAIIPSTGTVIFNPDRTQGGITYPITITASDGNLTASATVSVTVNKVSTGGGQQGQWVLNVDPVDSPSFLTTQRITGSIGGSGTPGPSPVKSALITGMSQTTGKQGETVIVTLTGDTGSYPTHFAQGSSVASFGTGITVTSLIINGQTQQATVLISINPTATLGPRAVSVTTGSETAVSVNAFNVLGGQTKVSGRLLDSTTGKGLAGATVVVQGTNITAITDSNGKYILQGVPTGAQTLLINAPNHELVTVSVDALVNTDMTLADIQTSPTVFDPATSPTATLLSVMGRGIAAMNPQGKSTEDLKKTVIDAITMTGGKSCGVLDEYGNQLNTNISGNGLVSLTSTGVNVLIERWRNWEIMTLGKFLRGFTMMFDWPNLPYQIETIQTLQTVVNEAWSNPQDPFSALMIAIFNRGSSVSPDPPQLRPETPLNALQTYLLTSSAFAWATREIYYKDFQPSGPGTGNSAYMQPNNNALLAYNGLGQSDIIVSDAGGPKLLAQNTSNKPVAYAGPDQTLTITEDKKKVDITLKGSGYDPSGGTITGYYWYKTSSGDPDPPLGPAEVTVSLTSGGHHTFRLYVVSSSGVISDPSEVNITITGSCSFSTNFDPGTNSWCKVFTNALKDSTLKTVAKPVDDYLETLTETLRPIWQQKPSSEALVKNGWVSFFEKANSQNVDRLRQMAETQGMKDLYKNMQAEAAAMNKSLEFIKTSSTIVKESLKSIGGAFMDMILDPFMNKIIDGIIEYSRPSAPFIQKAELVTPDPGQDVSQYVKVVFKPSLSELNDASRASQGTLNGIRKYAYLIYRNNDRITIVLANEFTLDSQGNYTFIDRNPKPGTNFYQIATRVIRSKTVPSNPKISYEQKILLDMLIDKVPGSDFTSRVFWKSLDVVEQILMGLLKQDSDLTDPEMVYVGSPTQNLHPTLEVAVDKNVVPNINYLSIPDTDGIFKILPDGISLYAFANFKTPFQAGLAIDYLGNLYSDNSASDAQFGGRIFRFTTGNTRELAGSVNYYSPDLQYARPTSVRALAYGIDDQGEGLFIADSLDQTIKRLDVTGGRTADLYNRNVGQLYANSPDFFFQSTTKMLFDARSTLFVTQGPDLFRVEKSAGGTLVRKVFPANKNPFDWLSGIDCDLVGNYYVADFSKGTVTMLPRYVMDSGTFTDMDPSVQKRYVIMEGLSSPVDLKVTDGGKGIIVVDGVGIHKQKFGVSGRIWDSQNGIYLAGADIIIGDGLTIGKTDADGFFLISEVVAPHDPMGIKFKVVSLDGRTQVFPNLWLADYGHTPLLEDLKFDPPAPPQPQPPGSGTVQLDPDPFPVQTSETVTSDTPGHTQMRNFVVPDRRIYLDTDPNAPSPPPPAQIKTGLDFVPSPGETLPPGPSGPTVIRPTISIISPSNGLITGEGSVPVVGMVVGGQNISQVTLSINGQDRQVNLVNGIFSDTITLRSGINSIMARAGNTLLDTSSNIYYMEGTTEPVIVTRDITAQPSIDYAGVVVLSGGTTLTAAVDMQVNLYAQVNGTNVLVASTNTKGDGTYRIHLDTRGQLTDTLKWIFNELGQGRSVNFTIETNNY